MSLASNIREYRMNAEGRVTFSELFMAIAETMAARADCTRRKVGAVIVDENNGIISQGYNGAPSGMLGCMSGGCPRGMLSHDEMPEYADYDNGISRCTAIHAEVNAILRAKEPVYGAVCYVTEKPCAQCFRSLTASGIVKVIWPDGEAVPYEWVEEHLANHTNQEGTERDS